MICPKCGRQQTKVQDSRTAESSRLTHLVVLGHKGADGPDFVARTRICHRCGWKGRTVELLETDLQRLKEST